MTGATLPGSGKSFRKLTSQLDAIAMEASMWNDDHTTPKTHNTTRRTTSLGEYSVGKKRPNESHYKNTKQRISRRSALNDDTINSLSSQESSPPKRHKANRSNDTRTIHQERGRQKSKFNIHFTDLPLLNENQSVSKCHLSKEAFHLPTSTFSFDDHFTARSQLMNELADSNELVRYSKDDSSWSKDSTVSMSLRRFWKMRIGHDHDSQPYCERNCVSPIQQPLECSSKSHPILRSDDEGESSPLLPVHQHITPSVSDPIGYTVTVSELIWNHILSQAIRTYIVEHKPIFVGVVILGSAFTYVTLVSTGHMELTVVYAKFLLCLLLRIFGQETQICSCQKSVSD